jgi:hypothetical protein
MVILRTKMVMLLVKQEILEAIVAKYKVGRTLNLVSMLVSLKRIISSSLAA